VSPGACPHRLVCPALGACGSVRASPAAFRPTSLRIEVWNRWCKQRACQVYLTRMHPAKDPSYKVKNTFLEFSIPEDNELGRTRRTRSDHADIRQSPLVLASKSPVHSPLLQPVDETMQAVPIDEVNFELLEEAAEPADGTSRTRFAAGDGEMAVAQGTPGLGRDEPAYVVPTTPSPFLHSAFPPSVVPPFGTYGYGVPDMGLPPAYGTEEQTQEALENQYMQGMHYLPEMYDPNYGYYSWSGVPVEGYTDGTGQDQSGNAEYAGQMQEQTWESLAEAGSPAAPVEAAERPKEVNGSRKKGRDRANREGKEQDRAEGRAATGGESRAGATGSSNAPAASSSGAGGGNSGLTGMAAADEKEAEVSGPFTTVMLRNIPNKYTREMLIKQLTLDFNGEFDFMYLPIDFKNKCNVGYGFINFRTTEACKNFVSQFHNVDVRKCLPGLNSRKVVEVTPARVQGLTENVRRLRNSPVMNQLQDHPEWMPLLFNEQGEEEPFPDPEQPLPPVKPRGKHREAKSDA